MICCLITKTPINFNLDSINMKHFKKLIPLVFVIFYTCPEAKQNYDNFQINGKIENVKDGATVFIRYDSIVDSTWIKNGTFKFTGSVPIPTKGNIYLKDFEIPNWFWIENTKIDVYHDKNDVSKTLIDGGKEQKIANILEVRSKTTKRKIDSISTFFVANKASLSKDEKARIIQQLDELFQDIENNAEQFIREFPNCYESASLLNSKRFRWDKELLKELFLLMNKDFQETSYGDKLSKYLKLNINPQIGDKYVDFTQKDTNNQEVKFSEVKNKYTLIEFWASWCVPCRKSNPELIKVYNTYHKNGFEIVGVSIDEDKDNWLNAIKQDSLPWVNLTDLKFVDNEAHIIYNVNGVPDNVLIDDEDIIIGRYLKPKELDSILSVHIKL